MDVKDELKFLSRFKKKIWEGKGWGVGVGLRGGQDGCDQRIEVLGKIHPKKSGRGGGGVFRLWGSGWM